MTGNIYLIGFMGAGKSTVGRIVADRLGVPFVDLDEEIVRADGRDVPTIFAQDGETAFRAAEATALRALADAPPTVVACGGGTVLGDANRAFLHATGHVVYLEVGAEEALARIGDTAGRPLLAGHGLPMANALLRSRAALYEAAADVVVHTSAVAVEEVADRVVQAIGGAA